MDTKKITLAGLLIGLLVTAIWGFNYTSVVFGERTFSPWALADLRFILSFFPLCFFVKKPNVSWKIIIAYGLTFGFLQFTLFFLAMDKGLSAGSTAIISEIQIYFTILLAVILDKERLTGLQILGMLISFTGIAFLFFISDEGSTLIGILLVLASALALAVSNIIVKRARPSNNFSFLIWASGVSIVPLIIYVLIWDKDTRSLFMDPSQIKIISLLAILYTAYASGILGFGLWNKLLGTYHTASVVSMSLLVPIFGLIFSHIFLGEHIGSKKILACVLMVLGLLVAQFGDKLKFAVKK